MKLYVYDIRNVGERVYVEGVRKRKVGNTWDVYPFKTSFDKEYFTKNVKQLKFPIVFDIKLVKGIGAQFNV